MEQLQQQLGFNIRWTAFPLHPETPHEGRALAELFAAQPGYMEAMWPRLRLAAQQLGLVLGERTHTFNSRNACEVAKWAEQQGHGWQFHLATYEAYFVEGKNIALPHILQEIAAQVGLDSQRIPEVITQEEFRDEVERDWQRCASLGIRAVPTIARGSEHLVGFQPAEALVEFIQC